jgi:hypothetical protein
VAALSRTRSPPGASEQWLNGSRREIDSLSRAIVLGDMTKLLEKAIARARASEDQDTLGAVFLAMTEESAGIVPAR